MDADVDADTDADSDADSDSDPRPCGLVTCAPEQLCCEDLYGGLGCIDPRVHPQHCGACGRTCGPWPETCQDGECICNGVACGGVCADIAWSDDHCGECGAVCADGDACILGACTPGDASDCGTCEGGSEACCAGECVDLRYDREHCGACDVDCVEEGAVDCLDGDCGVLLI